MQITIPALQLDSFYPKSLPSAVSGTCSAVVGSPNLSGNFTKWVGLEGFTIHVGGSDYMVVSVTPTVMVIDPVYQGTVTLNVPFTVYPIVFLRLYPLQPFTAQSDQQIIQPGAPGNGNFYKQASCSVIGGVLNLPELTLESTTDAINPGDRAARYFAGFYRPDGGLIQPYYRFDQFMLYSTPPVQTWAQIAAYNSPGVPPPPNYDTYNKDQINELFANGLADVEVLPPLIFDGVTLRIPKASATQDGYLSKEDYQMFVDGVVVVAGGVTEVDTGTGLTGGPITDSGTIEISDIPGLIDGMYENPSLTVNKQGQIIAIESGTSGGGPVTAPVITLVASSAVSDTGATITWHTDVPSDSQVEYGTDGIAYGTQVPPTPNLSPYKDHTVVIPSGLLANTTYHYHAKSANSAGLTVSDDNIFTTLAAPDTTPPTFTLGIVTVMTTTATINWTTSENADTQVGYGSSSGSYGTLFPIPPDNTSPKVLSHSVTLTGLTPGATYHYQLRSSDAAGNLGLSNTTLGDLTLTTTPPAPVITLGSPTLGDTSVTVRWTTNLNSDSQVDYGIGSYGTSTTPSDSYPPGTTIHAVTLSPLTPGQLYQYRVKSTGAGGAATPVTGTFTTTAGAPVITLGSPTLGDTSVTVHWTTDLNSDSQVDYGIGGYGTSTSLSDPFPPGTTSHDVLLSPLTPSQLYQYRVKSTGAGGVATPVTGTFTTNPVTPADLLTSLVAYWKFDEASGSFADSKGTTTLARGGTIGSVAGKIGNALQMAGDLAGYAYAVSNSIIEMGPSVDFTIAAWLQVASTANAGAAIAKGSAEYFVEYNAPPDSKFSFVVCGTSGAFHTVLATTGPPVVNTWYLVVCWHDSAHATINIQIDNGTPNSAPQEEPIKTGTEQFNIGCYAAYASAWNGLIDEVAIWKNRILSPSDILWLWNGGAGRPFGSW
jgi:Concanavalin A-like lectin/glucanases superfamily/Purple acid Phosphatase, N-terminal domain